MIGSFGRFTRSQTLRLAIVCDHCSNKTCTHRRLQNAPIARVMIPPSLLVTALQEVNRALSATCEEGSALSLRSPLGDGETHCSKIHSGEARDGSSCGAKQLHVTPHCGFTPRVSSKTLSISPH